MLTLNFDTPFYLNNINGTNQTISMEQIKQLPAD